MDAGQIESFLRQAGCDKIRSGTEWVKSTCPVAHLRHSGGRDAHPSFGVRIAPGEESRCRCLACGYSGSLYPLGWKLHSPHLFGMAHIDNMADWGEDSPTGLAGRVARVSQSYWGSPSPAPVTVMPVTEKNAALDEAVLDDFKPLPSQVAEYLQERGISRKVMETWEIGYHRGKRRVSIPIRDADGNLVSVSGRAYAGQSPKYLHSPFKRNLVLYGEHLAEEGGVAYLCEGFFQTMALWQAGYRSPLARMGTHLSREQAAYIVKRFSSLVIVPDGDKAGRESATEIADRLCSRIPVYVAGMPEGFDADTVAPHQLQAFLDGAVEHVSVSPVLTAQQY